MTCITSFKIVFFSLSEAEIDEIIEAIGVEPGMTEQFMFYGLQKRDTEEENYTLFEQLTDTLSVLYDKKELLKKLANIYPIRYEVNVKFSDIEDEIERNTSFTISDESKEFIDYIGAIYILNNGYFD